MRFNSEKPIFAQIAELLADDIVAERLLPGGRLPSARDLAASLGVNPNTAARALQVLADAGVARSERGTGYYVSEAGAERVREDRRKRFIGEELPRIFKAMDDLGIDFTEIEKQWEAARVAGGKQP